MSQWLSDKLRVENLVQGAPAIESNLEAIHDSMECLKTLAQWQGHEDYVGGHPRAEGRILGEIPIPMVPFFWEFFPEIFLDKKASNKFFKENPQFAAKK